MNIPRLRASIMRHEGFRQNVYDCGTGKDVLAPVGRVTIGYGRNVQDVGLTVDEAEVLLDNDIRRAVAATRGIIPSLPLLDPVRQEVLVEMVYQLGVAGVAGFVNMLEALAAGNYEQAAHEMLESKWRAQTPLRAEELANRMRTGEATG